MNLLEYIISENEPINTEEMIDLGSCTLAVNKINANGKAFLEGEVLTKTTFEAINEIKKQADLFESLEITEERKHSIKKGAYKIKTTLNFTAVSRPKKQLIKKHENIRTKAI